MPSAERVAQIQQRLQEHGLDAWLLYDFRGTNPLARTVLELTGRPAGSRRWFYLIPAEGAPLKLLHAIETDSLEGLPGEARIYRSWRSLHEALKDFLAPYSTVAMEYSAKANNPYVSRVDAGTIELIRSCDVDVVSSGDLVQYFDSHVTDAAWRSHLEADKVTTSAFDLAWEYVTEQVKKYGGVSEADVQKKILEHFAAHDMETYAPPTVARPPHNRLPHYETGSGDDTLIRSGDLLMIDLWCKQTKPGALYSDLTRMAFLGTEVPDKYASIFSILVAARDAGIRCVEEAFQAGRKLQGWEIDRTVRDVIEQAGYGDAFLHRTGHSLGTEVHGNGAHLDDLEMHEDRQILPSSLFTIEPGIYLDEFGMRTEVDVFVDAAGKVQVTGGPVQYEIRCLPC